VGDDHGGRRLGRRGRQGVTGSGIFGASVIVGWRLSRHFRAPYSRHHFDHDPRNRSRERRHAVSLALMKAATGFHSLLAGLLSDPNGYIGRWYDADEINSLWRQAPASSAPQPASTPD